MLPPTPAGRKTYPAYCREIPLWYSPNILCKLLSLLAVSSGQRLHIWWNYRTENLCLDRAPPAQLDLHGRSAHRTKVCICILTLFISSKSSVTCWQHCRCLEVICSVASGEEEITLNTCNQLINKVDQNLDTISPMILYL